MAKILAGFYIIMLIIVIFSFGMVAVWGMFEETQLGKMVIKKLKEMTEKENE